MKPMLSVLLLSTVVLALSACDRVGGLAPFTNVTDVPDSAGGAITVQKGDTAYSLSRRYNVPLRDLIDVNRLAPPYRLDVGQRLVLPTSRQYIVQKGDTLYGISRMFNVDVSELTRVNNLTPPYAVQAGQPLRLPGTGDGSGTMVASGDGAAAAGAAVPLTPQASSSSPPQGNTARRGSIQAAELPPPGASSPSPAAGIGATPLPPPAASPADGPVQAAPTDMSYQPGQAPTVLRPPGSKPAPAPLAAPSEPPKPAQPQQEVAAAPPPKPEPKAEVGAPPPRGSARFLWPVKGKLISGFGPKPDGLHNDGLNIAAAKGTAVVAADNGVVAYAGNELRGFGNLLLLKHSDGWITAYAHLDKIEVERGATVKRGQVVARVGQTGSVSSPQLHFELRKGSQAVDPTDQMDRKVSEGASRDDRPSPG
ncbi:LysM peptidoglycan-binding domain-containing M23 family metallopeptidase [Azospirillum picis]|uniref:Murein DD-endopeptidase MepM/ murein hydrolase activator NlpD n=1 Tax=Azospirillum picis TaxID=488438 RepID=A0ABU0MGU2_9PROT|nr:LysM peptidoglycan-binding domain-containing M23 family metallopeptidase [Azospirillum picis]MBP2298495.1 murein DD-endopeptidase MepM/ murein hydrolase activator NlpD [Azospirillum picis]MDQ0532456.1 murein DD-endopeptidase MepM/ murein hydrolase activator NlpD [Azospirillum picis]